MRTTPYKISEKDARDLTFWLRYAPEGATHCMRFSSFPWEQLRAYNRWFYWDHTKKGWVPFVPLDAQSKHRVPAPEGFLIRNEDTSHMTTRHLNSHKVNPANDQLEIEVMDGPGPGNANHHYCIGPYNTATNPGADDECKGLVRSEILFQNGPIGEVGVNGLTNEALLAVLIDRMQGFQQGPYASRENALALTNMEQAQMWLQKRTRDRMARGVEGTHEK